jgi:hypothetical protein
MALTGEILVMIYVGRISIRDVINRVPKLIARRYDN